MAWEVPMITLGNLLTNNQAQTALATSRNHMSHAVNHQHLPCAELVSYLCSRSAQHGTPRPWVLTCHTELLHIRLGKAGLLCRRSKHKRLHILKVGQLLVPHFAFPLGPHHSLASSQLLLGEEASHTIPHLNQQLAIHVAVVREEKHGDLALLLGKRVDRNVIREGLSFLRDTVEGQCGVQQPVHSLSLALEINAQVRNKHQIALATLHQHRPGDISTFAELTVDGQIVLCRHRAWGENIGRGVHLGHPTAQQVLALRQAHPPRIGVHQLPRLVHARLVFVEDRGDVALCVLQKIIKVPEQRLAGGSVLLVLRPLVGDLGLQLRSLGSECCG
mmetsp:Transcript_18951/g.41863  ORF Transcript_18951/g.41863 Transcript_18951/m.41863 type:complete len:332 (+) Transcript_18951:738-1733(+)